MLPTLPELSGLITEALHVDPLEVERHARGLESAGRLDPGYISANSATALLLACLSPDGRNATGAFHLPLSGVIWTEEGFTEAIDVDDPLLVGSDKHFGEYISDVVHKIRCRVLDADCVREIAVSGSGSSLKASVTLYAHEARQERWYGHKPLHQLLASDTKAPSRICRSHSTNGVILPSIADLLNGQLPAWLASLAPGNYSGVVIN